jgi:hypothetical protein
MKLKKFILIPLIAILFMFSMKIPVQAAWSSGDHTSFVFTQMDGENVVRVSTYSTWLGPDQKWPIATDSNDEWEAAVSAYTAEGKIIGAIHVPQSADGKVDYNQYVEKGISYIIVTQASGSLSDKYYVQIHKAAAGGPKETQESDASKTAKPGEKQAGNASEQVKPDETQASNVPKTAESEATPKTTSVHIVFTEIESEAYKVRAQVDNGQYGKEWWGIWDVSSEGDWASKIYVLDTDKSVLGQLSVPESALGLLDFSGYGDHATYIQIEHSMCIGIYEIAANTTIEGSLNDIIKEGDGTDTIFENYRMIIPAFIVVAIIFFAWLMFRRNNRKNKGEIIQR